MDILKMSKMKMARKSLKAENRVFSFLLGHRANSRNENFGGTA
jgi:hypothetical protein